MCVCVCNTRQSFLPYPLGTDTVQIHQDHGCSSQSYVFRTQYQMFCTSILRQRALNNFPTVKASSPIEIHRCLKIGYNEDAIDIRSVRHQVCCFKSSKKDTGDMVCSS